MFKEDIKPKDDRWQEINITDDMAEAYGLDRWAENFSLMTAGYRDRLDPADIKNPKVPFNMVTLAIIGLAKAKVFKKKNKGGTDVHIGGETRPHTQDFISLLARIYAAQGFTVHLRIKEVLTTPIWYSSFGIFYNQFQSGDNITASHSQFFKGGWKPLDSFGKQIVEEEKEIIEHVKKIVGQRETIKLAPFVSSKNIIRDFDIDSAYIDYQKSVISCDDIENIYKSRKNGLKVAVCTLGGSMKVTSQRLFRKFHIYDGDDEIISYFYDKEDSQYHKIGQINGENYGVDPTKKEIFQNIGAQKKLLDSKADFVFIWDPDGDRFNIVTKAKAEHADKYIEAGLFTETYNNKEDCIVYFTPNQLFFMLAAKRIESLKKRRFLLGYKDWFIASSVTTSKAIDELALHHGIKSVKVPVGFKHWGTFANWLENRKDEDEEYTTVLGQNVKFGEAPRLIIMCEESGGAVFGGYQLLESKDRVRKMTALREKDGFQAGLLTLALGAALYNIGKSFADYYLSLVYDLNIKNRFFKRHDQKLYDESLSGDSLNKAKEQGAKLRDKIIDFFRQLAIDYKKGASSTDICKKINSRISKKCIPVPCPQTLSLIGKGALLEGTYIEFEDFWFVIRASGTDALLRYYIEGRYKDNIEKYLNSLSSIT